MGCTDFIVKYALFFMNFFITIIGIIYVAVSSYVTLYIRVLFYDDVADIDNLLESFMYMAIMGSLIFIITFMGCCGAIAEKPYLLNTYALVMLILSALMIYIMIVIYSILHTWETTLESMERVNQVPLFQITLRYIEAVNQCCGTSGAISYEIYNIELPPTCCPGLEFPPYTGLDSLAEIQQILQNYNQTEYYCTRDTSYEGCITIISMIIYDLYYTANNATILTIAIELIAAIFAFYLAQHIRNEVARKKCTKSYTLRVKE